MFAVYSLRSFSSRVVLELSFRKMFTALFVFTLVTAYVTAEIPSYIRPCGRKDPNYDQCITNNVNNMKDKICTGIPELNIPPNEPLIFDKLVIYDVPSTKLYLRDLKVFGICDFVVNFIRSNPDRVHFNFDLTIKHLQLNTTYDFDINILMKIAHKGIVYITSDNVGIKVGVDLKKVIKNGKKYIYTSKMNTNLNVKAFNYKFDENEKELVQLHKILNDIIANNEEEIISRVIPLLEKEISKRMISVANNVLSTRYEELFPERT